MSEVETFLETKTHDGFQHKDANYIMAILDSRKKFVAHERFQYVLLKKFGEADQAVRQALSESLLSLVGSKRSKRGQKLCPLCQVHSYLFHALLVLTDGHETS